MGRITESLESESIALHSHLVRCRKMCSSWDKVRTFLDMMDMPDLHSPLPVSSTSSLSSSSFDLNLHPLSIGAKSWQVGEKTTQQILSAIQPTTDSEFRRKEIIEYLRILIEDAFGLKVIPFGSVPLKTYLPHGDLDLTVVSQYESGEVLAADICSLLENEEKNSANFPVREVLCVPAQVRVVKCTVGGVSVDISFNQTAGLCALYFLEQVDQYIGKKHLFKRSVILIKAWCYYESRLLGGVHGLISTYALETMVLHVINLFHSSLRCPLAVLYKFLEYYSTFDWKKFCIGINGLVLLSSLPEIEVVKPEGCDDLLLTEYFLRSSRETLMSSNGIVGSKIPAFPVKFLNILDPLKDDNNLGRSVSKGNFYRIRCALSYGTQKLREILMLPPEKIGMGLEKFFNNTLERNGKGRRADVLVPVPAYGTESSDICAANDEMDNLLADIQYGIWFGDYDMVYAIQPTTVGARQVWSNGGEGMGQSMQFHQHAYYNVEEFAPSSVDSPRGLHTVPFEEKWKPRGRLSLADSPREHQHNYGTSTEEKWIPRANPPVDIPRGHPPPYAVCAEDKWRQRGVPTSSVSPRGFQVNNAYAEEKWGPRGMPSSVDSQRGIPLDNTTSAKDYWKTRGASSSVESQRSFHLTDSSSAENKWKGGATSSIDKLESLRRDNEDKRKLSGATSSAYSPRAPSLDNVASAEEMWESKETCLYIEHSGNQLQRNSSLHEALKELIVEEKQESKKEESEKEVETVDAQAYTPKEENLSNVADRSSPVSYSLDEFPLLPGSKPIPIRPLHSAYKKCEQVKETPPSVDSTDLESCKASSPTSVSFSDGSVFLDALSDLSPLEEDQDSSKAEEKVVVPVQPPQLKDNNEFPPLPSPVKPVVTLSRKEFPPLATSVKSKSKKRNKWKNTSK